MLKMPDQMDFNVNLHNLIDLSKSKAAIDDVLDNIDDDFLWLEEILTECKNKFSMTSVRLLPKTPSQKKPPCKRVKRIVNEDLLDERLTTEEEQNEVDTSATPVRRLRTRPVRPTTSTYVTRSVRAAMKKKEEENAGPEPVLNLMTATKDGLLSVSEEAEIIACTPPLPSAASRTVAHPDSGGNVRQRAREYEHMLAEKQRISGSPRTRQQNVIDQKTKYVDSVTVELEGHDTASNSRRSSVASRRSSTASKRKSLRVLGSKARLRSMHGQPSVPRPLTGEADHENQHMDETESTQEKTQTEQQGTKGSKSEVKSEPAEYKTKAPRTRLRLKKTKNGTESSECSSTSGSTAESSKDPQLSATSSDEKDSETVSSFRTKRKEISQSSDEEPLKVPAKVAKSDLSKVSSESGTKTRTRTRAQKAEKNEYDITQDDVFESPKPGGATKSISDSTLPNSSQLSGGSSGANDQQNQNPQSTVDGSSADSGVDATANKTQEVHTDGEKESQSELCTVTGADAENNTTSSVSDSASVDRRAEGNGSEAKTNDKETSRRATHVINKAETTSEETHSEEEQHASQTSSDREMIEKQPEEESCPARSTRTKTRQAQTAMSQSSVSEEKGVDEPRMTRTKTRKRQAEEDADTSLSKRLCLADFPQQKMETEPQSPSDEVMEVNDEGADADDDSDYEDIDSEPEKVTRLVPSFLNQMKKQSYCRSGVVTSLLKDSTAEPKPKHQVVQAQKRKELLMKEKKEQERLSRMDEMKKKRVEEQKQKREERMRKVAEMRELRQKKENDLKRNLAEKLKEKLNSTDRMKEDRFREEREKQRLRLKKQLEAEERRRQEEEERLKRLLEQQEEQKRHEEFLQRKREHEEQERQKRLVEEKKMQEEKQAELERERQAEAERLRQQELARERERQLLKEQKEKAAAQERAEREKQELERKRERELKIQREIEKLKEMEQQRLAKMVAQEEEKRKEEAQLEQIIQQHNHKLQALRMNATLTLSSNTNMSVTTTTASATATVDQNHNANSYPITPVRQRKNGSIENYDISDLRSDNSTDDDEAPRKKIPSWAQGASLKTMLINQVYNPPDLDAIFFHIEPPDLNEMFERKRPRFNKRTSSAVWNSPLHKP